MDVDYVVKNFNAAKSYLYQLILKSLTSYNANKKEPYYLFNVIDILYRKGLYKNCTKMIKQLIKKEEVSDDYLAQLKAIEYVKYLKYSDIELDEVIEGLLSRESIIIEKQKLLSQLQSYLFQVKKIWNKTGTMKKEDSILIAQNIIQNLSKIDVSEFDNLKFNQFYHEAYFLCGLVVHDKKLTEHHFSPLQDIIFKNQKTGRGYDYNTIDVLNQLLRYHLFGNNFLEAKKILAIILKTLHASTVVNRMDKIAIQADCYIFEMHIIIQEKELSLMDQLVNNVVQFVAKNKEEIPPKFFMLYESNLLVMYFILGEYKKVTQFTNNVLSSKQKELRNDVLTSVMLIELIAFYQQEKYSLFESRLIAYGAHLKRNDLSEVMWGLFNDLMNNFLRKHQEKESIDLFLQEIEKHEGNQIVEDLDFLTQWVRSRRDLNQF